MSTKISDDRIINSFKLVKYNPLSIRRSGGRCIITYICPNGHKHCVRWDHWQRGDRCSVCRKTDISYIKREFEKEGYILISNEYTGYNNKLSYICPNGHRHSISWDAWKNQYQRCPYCAGNAKHDISFIKSEFEKEDYILLTKYYINAFKKLKFICSKGHVGQISWHKWNSGQRCVVCSNLNFSINQNGCGNSNWKGGISCEPYCDIWLGKDFKESIKDRDGYKCLNPYCFDRGARLSIHHIDYDKKNCELDNLITLCNSCNSMANKDRSWHKYWYRVILNKRYGYKYE